jgi:flagellar motor switch protein FliG
MSEQALNLAGSRKVAALLITLGTASAAKLLARLPAEYIDQVALELLRTPAVDSDVRDSVLEETYAGLAAHGGVLPGGEEYTHEVFAQAFGAPKAMELIERVTLAQRIVPFEFLTGTDPIQVASLLSGEHPQTIALVLAHLEPRPAALILANLEVTLQVEVARRIALTDQTTPDSLSIVEEGIRRRMASIVTESTVVGGARPLAHVLNQSDRTTEKQILGALAAYDQNLADEVRRYMFVFEDITTLDDRAIQRVVRELDQKDIALALRSTTEDVKNAFFRNISTRAAEMLKEEMSLATHVRMKNVEEAQGRIVEIIKRLEDQDEIVIVRGGGDDALV